MTQDITIVPFFISFDVINNCIDIQSIFDYVKTNYKKEVIILNGNDYLETNRHSSKSSSNSKKSKQTSASITGQNSTFKDGSENQHRSGRISRSSPHSAHDGSRSIVKGFQTKIESDLPKLIDNKRKFLQQQEKKRQARENQKSKGNSAESPSRKSSTSKSKTDKDEKPKFDGKFDVLYIIINFPYLPSQLQAMDDAGIPIDAFIALKNDSFAGDETQIVVKSGRSTDSKRNASKKGTVPGFSLDYINHPFTYPPLRWQMLESTAPLSVSFAELNVEPEVESTFNNLIDLLLRIQRQKTEVSDFLSGRKFEEIPPIPKSLFKPDLSIFRKHISYFDAQKTDDSNSPFEFVDALLSQLKAGSWDLIPPPALPTIDETYKNVFKKVIDEADRRVIACPNHPVDKSVDYYKSNESNILPSVYEYFYKFLHWTPNKENMYHCIAWCNFLKSEENLHCYAGQKFDLMYSRINKNYRFGLPMNFFDWQQWNLSVEHNDFMNYLSHCIQENSFIDSYFDEITGLQFILILKPIIRNIGSYVPDKYMPLSLTTNSEIKTNLLKSSIDTIIHAHGKITDSNETEKPKKSRKLITPSTIVNLLSTQNEVKGETFYQLLPTLNSRFESKDEVIYRMPIELTNSEGFITPYFFEKSKIDVHICRNCTNGKFSFQSKLLIDNRLHIFSSQHTVSVFPYENLHFYFTFPFSMTILFDDQSIYFDSEGIGLQITKNYPISITNQGDITFMKEPGNPYIVTNDGTIGRMVNQTNWEYVDSNGETFIKTEDENGHLILEKVERPHSSYYDGSTKSAMMIRPDGVNYVIHENNVRVINFVANDLKILQDSNHVEFDIDKFPIIL